MTGDAVREAIEELRWLTECRCDPAWTERGRHDPHCASDCRADVNTLAKALRPVTEETA